jgi:hypothetical protein
VNFVEEAAIPGWNSGELDFAARRLHAAHHAFDNPRTEGIELFDAGDIKKRELRGRGRKFACKRLKRIGMIRRPRASRPQPASIAVSKRFETRWRGQCLL